MSQTNSRADRYLWSGDSEDQVMGVQQGDGEVLCDLTKLEDSAPAALDPFEVRRVL